MRQCVLVFATAVSAALMLFASPGRAQVISADPSGAKRFLSDAGEVVTLYGERRFDALYEPGRAPPPTDPNTGWPLDWSAPYLPVAGAFYSPYGYRYSPYGYGFYRSLYRPRYVPYGYGYGWGYRYPFGAYPWSTFRYGYHAPWHTYDLHQPWYGHGGYDMHSPYVDHGPSFIDDGHAFTLPRDFGGCFYW